MTLLAGSVFVKYNYQHCLHEVCLQNTVTLLVGSVVMKHNCLQKVSLWNVISDIACRKCYCGT